MPFTRLTNEQIHALLKAKPMIESVRGVMLFWVDLIGPGKSEPAIVAYVDSRKLEEIDRLPSSVAGVPVVVRVEDWRTMRVIETIDPRDHGGVWPASRAAVSSVR